VDLNADIKKHLFESDWTMCSKYAKRERERERERERAFTRHEYLHFDNVQDTHTSSRNYDAK
jgi:hypothetical protein